jgi:AraC family transcriptional regulator
MVLNQFPDLQWLKQQAEMRFVNRKASDGTLLSHRGWPTVILNTQARQTYRDNIRGPFSLFTNLQGESIVEANGRNTRIKENFFFLTNHNQHYTLKIDKHQQTETFNIHFGEYFADSVLSSLQSPEKLLDNQFEVPSQPIAFHNRLQPHDAKTKNLILKIKAEGNPSSLWLEEKLYELMTHLFSLEKAMTKKALELPAIKSSTKQEIFQRLLRSSDYIFSCYDRELSLEELANAACLSKFHFLRLFKIAFQKTPHQFINNVRLQRAKELLHNTSFDVQTIAKDTGFVNSSSFSRMFRQHIGVYPTQFRLSK